MKAITLPLTKADAYLKTAAFIAANIALPHIFHLIPNGGVMFLPIYFFTLVAAVRYGWQVGTLTAVMSPVVGYLAFGAPMLEMLPDMLFKGVMLSLMGALTVKKLGVTLAATVMAVVAAWLLVGLAEMPVMGATYAFQDFLTGYPGMIMLSVGAWLIGKYVK